ncbi:MAG: hypothetical protein P1V36_04980, partial [Planctomycetota bacterium]|nr:hypothetical protein [Planctomycetota bacterium]
ETVKPPREGRGGRPGTCEIDFFPGVILEPADDKGEPSILREVGLDDPEEPTFFVGFRPDGVQTRVEIETVKKKQREALLEKLKARAKPADNR